MIVEVSQNSEGNSVFFINGLRQKIVVANAGDTIVFDQSDSSNAGHRLRIALYPDGAHLYLGSEYTPGVTFKGTPGQAGAKTTFTVSDANLHGTYFYYCENHRFMGGMIHYGNNPAKYRLIDEGATASDAQDEDLTSNIVKTVEQYNELTELWDHVYDQSTNHSNPWAVQNTDTRNSSKYRIRYEVQDSQGLADINTQFAIDAGLDYSTSRQKLINISASTQTTGLLTLRNRDEYLYGHSGNISSNYGWLGGAMLGIWGWQGMPGLSKFNFTSNNYTNATWSNALAYWYVPSGNAWNKTISFEVPLNTWIQCISFGKYTGAYNYGYTIGLHRNTFSTGNQHFRSRCIEDSGYPNGNTSSRIRFPGSNVTNWNGYDANHLYPPGSPGNGSANQEAWRGLSGETERNGSIGTKNSYHAWSQREHVSVFKILDSVTVDFNFGNIF